MTTKDGRKKLRDDLAAILPSDGGEAAAALIDVLGVSRADRLAAELRRVSRLRAVEDAKRERETLRTAGIPRTCSACGTAFAAYHPAARYCGPTCRQRAHRAASTA